MERFLKLTAAAVLAVFFAGCATAPMTGRLQFMFGDEDQELREGAAAYHRMLHQAPLSDNQEATAMVKRVSARLIQAAEQLMRENKMERQIANYQWEVNLLEVAEPNAVCFSGGKIAVFTGFLSDFQNEDEAAGVIGHEITHALARHVQERESTKAFAGIATGLGDISAAQRGDNSRPASRGLYYEATGQIFLPYAKELESESDRIGLTLMAMAGYDPRVMVNFWSRMAAKPTANRGGFFSTHPADAQRASDISKLLPEALARYTPRQPRP